MGIGDIIAFVSIGIGIILAYPALLILLNLLFGKTTTRVADRLDNGMKTSFFVGLIIVGIVGAFIFALISAGSVLQFIGFVLYLLISFWGIIGNAALSRLFGRRMTELGDKDTSSILYEMLTGGFVLTLSFAFPLVGWFVVMPIMTCIGVGSMTLNLFSRKLKQNSELEVAEVLTP